MLFRPVRLSGTAITAFALISAITIFTATKSTSETDDQSIPAELLAIAGDVPYGEYLSAECAGCHVVGEQSDPGVPRIDNLSREDIMLALVQYRTGIRENEVMGSVARSLGDEEIAALAAYFEQLEDE